MPGEDEIAKENFDFFSREINRRFMQQLIIIIIINRAIKRINNEFATIYRPLTYCKINAEIIRGLINKLRADFIRVHTIYYE